MGGIINKFAYLPPDPPSYTEEFITGKVASESGAEIPYVFIERTNTLRKKTKYPQLTLLLSHGNAEDLGTVALYRALPIAQHCDISVCAYDYTGYGLSTSGFTPSESNSYHDIQAIYEMLQTKYSIPQQQIISFGISIGSGPTTHFTHQNPEIGGCILQSPIASAIKTVFDGIGGKILRPLDIYRNMDKISYITVPVFVMHGLADEVVPVTSGKILTTQLENSEHKKTNSYPPWFIEKAGHNDIEQLTGLEYFLQISKFIAHVEKTLVIRDAAKALSIAEGNLYGDSKVSTESLDASLTTSPISSLISSISSEEPPTETKTIDVTSDTLETEDS